MPSVRVLGGIPFNVFEAVLGAHPAVDPETGHFECHYAAPALGFVDLGGVRLPALVAGCLAVTVAESLPGGWVEASGPIALRGRWVEARGARAPRELLRVYAALAAQSELEVSLYRSEDGALAVAARREGGSRGVVLVLPAPCEEEGGEGPGMHL